MMNKNHCAYNNHTLQQVRLERGGQVQRAVVGAVVAERGRRGVEGQ